MIIDSNNNTNNTNTKMMITYGICRPIMPSYGRLIIGMTYRMYVMYIGWLMIMLFVINIPNKHNHAVRRIDCEDSLHSSSCLS